MAENLQQVERLKAKRERSEPVSRGLEGDHCLNIRIEIRGYVDRNGFGPREVLQGSSHVNALEFGPEAGRGYEGVSPVAADVGGCEDVSFQSPHCEDMFEYLPWKATDGRS